MPGLSILERLYRRRVAIILSVLLSSTVLINITYHFFGHALVSNVYYKKSFSFLNSVMAGRGHTPLKYYLAKADGIVHKLLFIIFVLISVTLIYAISRKIALLVNRKFYFKEGSTRENLLRLEITESISVGRLTVLLFFTLFVVSVPLWFSKYAPLLDYPWHIARIYILENLDKSPLLQSWYVLKSFNLPNVGFDFVMLFLVKIFSLEVSGRVFIVIVFAITLSGTVFLYRVVNGRFAVWPLLASLFLYNWIFLFGFLNYLLGIGLLLWAIGIWLYLIDSNPWLRLLVGTVLTSCLYFAHIAALGLYAITIAGYELQRSCRTLNKKEWLADRDLFLGAAIFFVPLLLFITSPASGHKVGKIIYAQPWLKEKFGFFYLSLMSGNRILDTATISLLVLFIIFLRFFGKFHIAKSMYFPIALLLIAFLALPLAGLLTGGYIDTRIPIAIVFIVIGCSTLTIKDNLQRRILIYSFFVFLIVRSALLAYDWHKYDYTIQEFTTAFKRMPSGSIMFVVSGTPEPTLNGEHDQWHPPVLHLGSLATIQQEVFVATTKAFPLQTPIVVNKRLKKIRKFQKSSPPTIQNPEELKRFINEMRMLVVDADFPLTSTYLLVIDPGRLENALPELTETVDTGTRFTLLKVLS